MNFFRTNNDRATKCESSPHMYRSYVGIVAVFLACLTSQTYGSSITVLSRVLQTTVDWTEQWHTDADNQDHSTSGHFEISSTSLDNAPLAATVASTPHGWETATSIVDSFSLNMGSYSSPWWVADSWGQGALPETALNIYSTATTRFTINSGELELALSGYSYFNYTDFEQDMQVTLRDITGSSVLLDLAGLGQQNWTPFEHRYDVGTDPSHEYELTIFGRIGSWDAKMVDMQTNVQLSPTAAVPDSGSSMLLTLCLTITGLVWFHRRMGAS